MKKNIENKLLLSNREAVAILTIILSVSSAVFFIYSFYNSVRGIFLTISPSVIVNNISLRSTDWNQVLNSTSKKENLNVQIDYSGIMPLNLPVYWYPNNNCSGTGQNIRNFCLLGRCKFTANALIPDSIGLMSISIKIYQDGQNACKSAGIWLTPTNNLSVQNKSATSKEIYQADLLTRCKNKESLLYFDFNQDCRIDAADIQTVTNTFLNPGLTTPYCFDINSDKKIDAFDIQLVTNTSLGLAPIKNCELKLNFVKPSIVGDSVDDRIIPGQYCEVPSPGNIDNNELSFNAPSDGLFSYCGGWISTYNFMPKNNPLVYPNKFLFNNFLGYGPNQSGVNFRLKKIAYDLIMASPSYWGENITDNIIAYNVSVNEHYKLGDYSYVNHQLTKSDQSYVACSYQLTGPGVIKKSSTTYPVYRLTDTKDVYSFFPGDYLSATTSSFFTVTQIGGAGEIKMFQGQYGLYSTITLNPL